MTRFLRDPLRGHLTLVAEGRAGRPDEFRGGPVRCPFCPGHEEETPPEISARGRDGTAPDTPGWRVRVVPNRYPALAEDGAEGLARGRHEVVVETPVHDDDPYLADPAQVAETWRAVGERLTAHREAGWLHVAVFRNRGALAGATLRHPHTQVAALDRLPPALEEEEAAAAKRADGCWTCDWMADPALRVAEGPDHVAFVPFAPRVDHEVWVVPRVHAAGWSPEIDPGPLADLLVDAARRQARVLGDPDWNLVFVSRHDRTPPGIHWRVELIPRRTRIAGFELGADVLPIQRAPADAARMLREANA